MKEIFEKNKKEVATFTKDRFRTIFLFSFYDVEEADIEYDTTTEKNIYFCAVSNEETYKKIAEYLGVYKVNDIYVVGETVYVEYSEFAPSAKEACETLSRAINSSQFSRKEFIETFKKEHRSLQSEMYQLFLNIIREMAKEDYPYDGRNEWCHNKSKEIVNVIGE